MKHGLTVGCLVLNIQDSKSSEVDSEHGLSSSNGLSSSPNRSSKQYFLSMGKFKNILLVVTGTARVSPCQSLPQQCYMSAGLQPPMGRPVPCPATGSSELGPDPRADVTAWPQPSPSPGRCLTAWAGCCSWPPPACRAPGWQRWSPRLLPPRVQVALTVPQFPQPL